MWNKNEIESLYILLFLFLLGFWNSVLQHQHISIFSVPSQYLTFTKTEGKFSFPILHCIRQDPKDSRLSSILKQRTSDDQVKKYAQSILRDAGSLTYTRERCTTLKNDILQQILNLGGNRPLETLIQLLDVQLEKLDASILPSQPAPSSPSSATNSYEPQQKPRDSTNISPATSWRIDST